MRLSKRRALSSNLFTGLIVGGFVGVVVIALAWTNYLPTSQQSNQLSFQQFALFGGPASMHSYNATCAGAAQLELSAQNPTPNPITLQNITISGSGVTNATIYIALSNSCITISEAGVSIPAGADYQLVGYVNQKLAFASTYRCLVIFGNGQILNQSLIAQS